MKSETNHGGSKESRVQGPYKALKKPQDRDRTREKESESKSSKEQGGKDKPICKEEPRY